MTDEQFWAVASELQMGREALQTIATAVEKIAAASPDPKKPINLRDLTDEEREIIEGLRAGENFTLITARINMRKDRG